MLGQHPALYGLPEVNPFIADTLGKTVTTLGLVRPRSLDGLYRVVAELEFGDQSERTIELAKAWTQQRRSWSMRELLDHISATIAPRSWIDKSPSTVLSKDGLARARRMFPDAHYLHLTRHPRPTCNSIHTLVSKNRANGLIARRMPKGKDPEESWLRTNLGICRFTAAMPPGQCMTIRGEDLLGDPTTYLLQICEWLGIDSDPDVVESMLHPETSPYAKIGPRSAPFGNDPGYLRNPKFTRRDIPVSHLDGALEWRDDDRRFSSQTIELAHRLGYR